MTQNREQGTGELNLFLAIWEERPHVSELTGRPLLPKSNPEWIKQFLHVLNKGRFDSLREQKENIMLGLPEEHEHQDTYPKFKERKIKLLKQIYDRNI